MLCHKRLGHISKVRIESQVKFLIHDFSYFKICVECIKRKQTNIKKFDAKRSLDVLDVIHTTNHEKSQALNVFKAYKDEVENQRNKKM